jgi:transposase
MEWTPPPGNGIDVPKWKCHATTYTEEGVTMKITTVGIDLAKNVFQVHGVNSSGAVVVRRQLRRDQVTKFFTKLEPCLVGMEACGSAHHWARQLQAMGHTVKLMAPQFVKPYVKANKHDVADAEAICEAVTRPNMRFVSIKTVEQQAVLALHRARQGMVKARTAQANQIRGLLAEFGLALPQGIHNLPKLVPTMLDDEQDRMPGLFRALILRLLDHFKELHRQVDDLEKQILQWHRTSPLSLRVEKVPGIGPLTATALVASVGDARNFANGRQLAAWLGLVPKQHSTGGKAKLLGISKRGETYLRTLFIHGGRAVVKQAERPEQNSGWLGRLVGRRNKNVAAVAMANKNARTVWALLAHDREYRPDYAAA